MLEITELSKGTAYAVSSTKLLTHDEIERLSKDFASAEAKPVFLDPEMTIQELDRERVYAFRIPGVNLQPYQIELFRKSLWENTQIKGVFLEDHVEMSALTFDDYEYRTDKNAVYPELGDNTVYPTLGALGEGGEVLDKVIQLEIHLSRLGENVKKLWRDHGATSQQRIDGLSAMLDEKSFAAMMKLRDGLLKELGDVLWYTAAIAREFHVSLAEIAKINIEKLTGRLERGTIGGSGDNR